MQEDLSGHAIAWATVWAASAQGPYPIGAVSAQPDLGRAFVEPAKEACNQSLRMIVRPALLGRRMRIRFTNAWGDRPLTIAQASIGLCLDGAALVPGTLEPVTVNGATDFVVEPGQCCWSDPVQPGFAAQADERLLAGRKLAVSFHIAGPSGAMTWHARAQQTSYVGLPGGGNHVFDAGESGYPLSTVSWYFMDALDVEVDRDNPPMVVAAFGDSITDGTGSTLNHNDRWPDVLQRRLHGAGRRAAVINAGIGSNQVLQPLDYGTGKPFRGGPAALVRLERDVLTLSGVSTIIWLEGINDLSDNGLATAQAVWDGLARGVAAMRRRLPNVRILAGTVLSARASRLSWHGSDRQEQERQRLNTILRNNDVFDGVIDFDRATFDASTGGIAPLFIPESTCGGAGDGVHPNRAGYLSMGMAVDLSLLR